MKKHNSLFGRSKMVIVLAAVLFLASLLVQPVAAASLYRFVSPSGTDSGTCNPIGSACKTIAYAVSQAVDGDTIQIATGTYNNEHVDVNVSVTFLAAGMNATIVNANTTQGGFVIASGKTVSISDMTIQNGNNTGGSGGGINNTQGNLTLARVKVTGNSSSYQGGGIDSYGGSLSITDSEISNNTAAGNGGGGLDLYPLAGNTYSLDRVTISGNTASKATSDGGGMLLVGSGHLNLTNVTITGNTAREGGGISSPYINSPALWVVITNTTIASNKLAGTTPITGGLYATNDTVIHLTNTLISGNDGDDCLAYGGITNWYSYGNNLDSDDTCNLTATGDLPNTDPKLDVLASNGGYIKTMALLDASPAINAGTNSGGAPAVDARGVTRPQGTTTDIGAYEYSLPAAYTKSSPANSATRVPLSITLQWTASAGATSYWVCHGTTSTCSGYPTNTLTNSLSLSGLSPNTTYYWNVRAVNAAGMTYADASSTAWSFTTQAPPAAFGKINPTNAAPNQLIGVDLQWGTSSLATSYEFCIDNTNNNACDYGWTDNGTGTGRGVVQLSPNTTYYWQARALNSAGTTYADGGTWWSWTTGDFPAPFNKSSPANGATAQPTNPTLSWATSSGATSYRYCIDTSNNDTCNASWISTGAITHIDLSGLTPGATYYWEARAVNSTASTYANGGIWWSFSVAPLAPGAFSKTTPTNAATGQATNPTLTWSASSGATSYRYCIDTSNNSACNAAWISTGAITHIDLSGLTPGATYYWQARAINASGSVYANSGTWWSFSVAPLAPGAFSKTTPTNAATGQATNPTLTWAASSGATSYRYCIDTSNNSACNAAWISTGAITHIDLSGLTPGATYYWEARAINASGSVYADSGTWWSFKVGP